MILGKNIEIKGELNSPVKGAFFAIEQSMQKLDQSIIQLEKNFGEALGKFSDTERSYNEPVGNLCPLAEKLFELSVFIEKFNDRIDEMNNRCEL